MKIWHILSIQWNLLIEQKFAFIFITWLSLIASISISVIFVSQISLIGSETTTYDVRIIFLHIKYFFISINLYYFLIIGYERSS
jgi:hypothetical protein